MKKEDLVKVIGGVVLVLIFTGLIRHEYKITRVGIGSGVPGELAKINQRLDDLTDKVTKLLAGTGSKPEEEQAVEAEKSEEGKALTSSAGQRPNFKEFVVSPDTGKLEGYALVEATPHYNLRVKSECPAPTCPCKACPESHRRTCPELKETELRLVPKPELKVQPEAAPKAKPKGGQQSAPARPCQPRLRSEYREEKVVKPQWQSVPNRKSRYATN